MKKALILVGFLGLTACAVPLEPVVASFNEASVGIQVQSNLEFLPEDQRKKVIASADEKAADVCRRGPNRTAEYTSSRMLSTGPYTAVTERLYLCLK